MKTNKSRKRLCSALLCLILTVSMLPITGYAGEGEIAINEENFPDDNFRAIVSQKDKDGDGFLSAEEIKSVTSLSESGMYTEEDKKIKSLKGIEYFTSLNHLAIIDHNLSSLDVSKLTNLEHLHIEKNPLTEIDVSNNTKLTTLYCQYNQLTKIDVSQNMALTLLYCHCNQLTWVDITNLKKLNNFLCSENKYPILLGEDNVFNIDRLPQGFNVSKASNWQNGSLSGDKTKLTVSDGSKKVTYTYDCGNGKTAKFSLVPTYGITVQNDDHGKVTASIASANVTSAAAGKKVTLDAIPDEGYQFKAWEIVSGNITINDNKFTMPANPVTVKAIFEQKKYAVTVQTEGNGTASASVASAAQGEAVTLTAAPNEGYEFDKWVVEDNKVTLANPNSSTTTFTMPASEVTIKASFKKEVASGGSSGGSAYVPSTPAAPSNPKPSGSAITSDVSGSTSRKDGETSTKVDQSTADKLVDAAIDNKSTDIVIDTASKTENGGVPNVKASEVTLPTETIKNIAEKTDASLTIKTDVGEIKLDNKAAASVSKQGENIGAPGEQETISIIAKKVKEDTEEVRYELEIKNSGGKTISDFRGGTATITVPIPSGLQGESLICVYIDKKGHYNKVKGKWTADGRYAFSTGHFSTYAMMREITADTVIAKQKAAVRKMTMEVRTKIVKTKSGKQAIRVTWTSGGKIIPDGVQIYRSTKKGGSFGKKPIFTTEKTRYLNTAVKTGQRYYYKVRGYVTIDGETVYTKLSGKGNRKLPETV